MSNQTQTSRVVPVSATTPTIYNVTLALAATEYSRPLSSATKQLTVRNRTGTSNVRMAFSPGGTSTDWVTLKAGAVYSQSELDLTGVTLYLRSDDPAQIIEVLQWT